MFHMGGREHTKTCDMGSQTVNRVQDGCDPDQHNIAVGCRTTVLGAADFARRHPVVLGAAVDKRTRATTLLALQSDVQLPSSLL